MNTDFLYSFHGLWTSRVRVASVIFSGLRGPPNSLQNWVLIPQAFSTKWVGGVFNRFDGKDAFSTKWAAGPLR